MREYPKGKEPDFIRKAFTGHSDMRPLVFMALWDTEGQRQGSGPPGEGTLTAELLLSRSPTVMFKIKEKEAQYTFPHQHGNQTTYW